MARFKELAERVGTIVEAKNKAYGNSFDQAGEFLKLLYPNGIPPESYGDMLCVVRIFDKLKRIATKKDAFGESPYSDIVGYGLLGLDRDERAKERLEQLRKRVEEAEEATTAEGGELAPSEQEHVANSSSPPSPLVSPTGEEMAWTSCAQCGETLGQPVPKKFLDEGTKFFMHAQCYEIAQKEAAQQQESAHTTPCGNPGCAICNI